MKAGEVTFQELLNGKIQYRVPLFQRTYSWKEENWQRLWDDALEIYELPSPRSHFIGAVVTQPIPDSPEFCSKFMLIDGQQRLTTLLILLSAIRDAARALDSESSLASEIEDECLLNPYARVPSEREKLRPTQVDVDDFNAVVANHLLVSLGAIVEAHRFFTRLLKNGASDGSDIDLARLKSCLTNYLNLVSIKLDGDDSAPRIFESLNNTGMALTASDLVRNHIFMNVPDEREQESAYNAHSLPMQTRMEKIEGKSPLTQFFWNYIRMDGDLPTYDEVFAGMRDRINTAHQSGRTILDILSELDTYSQLYVRIADPRRYESSQQLQDQLSRLNQWEIDVAYPFILKSMQWCQSGQIEELDLVSVLRSIESYVVRRFVCDVPTNRLRRIFAGLSSKVTPISYAEATRDYLIENDWPTDSVFEDRFASAPMYNPARLARTRLILTSLEESFEHHETVEMGPDITIEHLLPQTLSDVWRESLGAEASQIQERYLHTIGNLTYSGYNKEMGNLPFDAKKNILRDSHFELNRKVCEFDSWTAATIDVRARELAHRALAIWMRS